jgi:hypothetical protein
MIYKFNDGGRANAGYKGNAGDCGARAMAIALNMDYEVAYKKLAEANKQCGFAKSARNGLLKEVYESVLNAHGFVWHSAPKFVGRKARASDMPKGAVIARQAGHYVAVIDGVVNDTWDCTNKMVYGYWAKI